MSAIAVALKESGDYGKIADAASEYFSLKGNAEAELVFASPEEIRELNRETRNTDVETDVLSFPALSLEAGNYPPFTKENFPFEFEPESGRVELGSIVVCPQIAERQAAEYGHGAEREKGYLFLHGLLHLLGFDHIEEADKKKMRKAQEEILIKVGLERR